MQKSTVEILKNFSTINQSILIHEGNQLATMATTKNIFASAVVEDVFPRDFAIYNLPEFLSVLSLFSEPKIEYGENDITIKEGVDLKEFINLPDDVCVEEAQITLRGSIATPQG